PLATTGRPSHQAGWDERYTTRTMLDTEQRLVDAISSGRVAGVGTLSPENVRVVVADAALGDDQRASALRLVTQGNGVEVLVGRAGTGKTYTVATVAAAYRAARWRVVGVCPSARA